MSRDATGMPIEHFVAFHRGDRSRFEFRLLTEGSSVNLSVVDTQSAPPGFTAGSAR